MSESARLRRQAAAPGFTAGHRQVDVDGLVDEVVLAAAQIFHIAVVVDLISQRDGFVTFAPVRLPTAPGS